MTKQLDKDPKTGKFVKGNKFSFKHRPEAIKPRVPEAWGAEDTIGYQYKMLVKMSVAEFNTWLKEHPEDKRTVAQELAYQALMEAKKDLQYLKEVTDRTEGKAPQSMDITTGGESLNIFEDEQIERIAQRRVARGGKINGDSSSEE